jgi:hypothetical protein
MPDEHESADNKPNSAARVPGPPAAVSMSGPSTEFALGEVLAIGGPTTSSWREDALARIAELEMLTMMAHARSKVEPRIADEMAASIRRHLDTAKTTAEQRPRRMAGVAGADVTRVLTNIHAAEADLLRLAPIDYLLGQISTLQAYVREHLPARDPRRARLEALVRSADTGKLGEAQRGAIVAAAREANAEARREVTRVRSFRNVLLACAAILTVAAIGVAILGIVQPDAMPLCFHPGNKVVCPTEEVLAPPNVSDIDGAIARAASPWDLPIVELVGLIAAAVAAAVSLRSIKGTTTPFGLPVALALLKLPTGALTAVLGLLLMRGQFVPGLSALDSSAQIIAWAVLFGYAQQLFTGLVDAQAQTVLDDVSGKTGPGAALPEGAASAAP